MSKAGWRLTGSRLLFFKNRYSWEAKSSMIMLSPEASRAYIVSYSSTWSQSLRGKKNRNKQNTKQLANQRTTKNILKKKEARKKDTTLSKRHQKKALELEPCNERSWISSHTYLVANRNCRIEQPQANLVPIQERGRELSHPAGLQLRPQGWGSIAIPCPGRWAGSLRAGTTEAQEAGTLPPGHLCKWTN